jgi:hypothetical protein
MSGGPCERNHTEVISARLIQFLLASYHCRHETTPRSEKPLVETSFWVTATGFMGWFVTHRQGFVQPAHEGEPTVQTDAHNMGREEPRALLEQRRSAVARELRRLAIELTQLSPHFSARSPATVRHRRSSHRLGLRGVPPIGHGGYRTPMPPTWIGECTYDTIGVLS